MNNVAAKLVLALSCLQGFAYAAPADQFLDAPGPSGSLKATFLDASGAANREAPVVLIIPGSGPTDRDGNSPLGLKASTYRLLAEQLAQMGVSTVRIDKRGMFASGGAVPDPNKVTIEDYAEDVQAWATVVKAKTGLPCIWVLGHSEGGLVALAAAQRPADLCGLVLVATAGRPLGDVLREQLTANGATAPLRYEWGPVLEQLERGQHVDVAFMHPLVQRIFPAVVQDFLISDLRLDPAKLIGTYRGPVLVLQGDKDLQVSVEDANKLGQASSAAKVVLLPGVNHVLKLVLGETRAANSATYADPSLPLASGVAEAVAGFVLGVPRALP